MPFYKDSETLCGVMTDLFQRAMQTPAAVRAMQNSHLVVRMNMQDPAFVLTIDGKSRPPRFLCEADGVRPDLVLRMPADVLHRVWLGQIRLRDAFFGGQIKLEGSMLRAMGLAELFRQVEALYPSVLEERGLDGVG